MRSGNGKVRTKVEVGDQSRRSRVLTGNEDNVNEERVIDVPMDYTRI